MIIGRSLLFPMKRWITQLQHRTFWQIPAGIWGLGLANFFMNISSILVFTFTPLFLKNVLGASFAMVGAIEAVVESSALFTRIFSGVISDIAKKRKAFIGLGYGLSILSRVFLSLSAIPSTVAASRVLDRVSNGIQASPRDALVADLAPEHLRGRCYGLRHSLTTGGSLLGSGLGVLLAYWTSNHYRSIFWFSLIPAVLALIALWILVKDKQLHPADRSESRSKFFSLSEALDFLRFENLSKLPSTYWKLMVVSFLLMTGNFSGSFLIYAAEFHGAPGYMLPLVMVIQNIIVAPVAFYAGKFSDQLDRRLVLGVGIAFLAMECLLLGTASHVWHVFLAVIFCGFEMGIIQSPLMGLITDNTPESLRGTAFGTLHLISGCAVFFSNLLIGSLWDISQFWAFSSIAILTIFALIGLCFIPKSKIHARMDA